jgi:hypothetical protein
MPSSNPRPPQSPRRRAYSRDEMQFRSGVLSHSTQSPPSPTTHYFRPPEDRLSPVPQTTLPRYPRR